MYYISSENSKNSFSESDHEAETGRFYVLNSAILVTIQSESLLQTSLFSVLLYSYDLSANLVYCTSDTASVTDASQYLEYVTNICSMS